MLTIFHCTQLLAYEMRELPCCQSCVCSARTKALALADFKFPLSDGPCEIPLFAFEYGVPVEGYPPKVVMEKFAPSLFMGFERFREPLEIHPKSGKLGDPLFVGSVGFTKGFTRASILAFGVIQTIMREDESELSQEELEYFKKQFAFNLLSSHAQFLFLA